ncbi:MAG: RNA-guided pseudouridylation complex pseudouridine synthase subunit Cbf5 [archaeon]
MRKLLPFEKIKRDVFVRQEAETSPKFGHDFEALPIDQLLQYCVINVDKSAGPTSHQVSAYVQKILGVSKGGHSGTLDPKVTGVLPVAIGRATRIVQALLVAGKEYICLMHLHKEVDKERLLKTFEKFTGKIAQLPPIKSAVKRRVRFRKIYYIELLDMIDKDVLFRVGTQAGTYIRKLVHDMGVSLGTGAHMHQLRRSKAGPFAEDSLCTLHELTDAFHYYKADGNEKPLRKVLQPIENAVGHLPKVWITDMTVDPLCHGANLAVPGIAKVHTDIQVGELVALMTLKNELVAIGDTRMISKEMVKEDKGIAIDVHKVFMAPGTYPRYEKPASV